MFSRLYIGGDTPGDALELREIREFLLAKTNLVILAGCQTQIGPRGNGDDVIAMNRSFLEAGAASVVASLSKVNEESTIELMDSFIRNLLEGKPVWKRCTWLRPSCA